MAKNAAGLLLGLLISLPVAAQQPATGAKAGEKSTEQILATFRDDLQAAETEILSKSISLSADEAANFWPVFKQFQSEQKAIIDGQITALTKFANEYATLTDDNALAYVTALRPAREISRRILEGPAARQGRASDPPQPQAGRGEPGEARLRGPSGALKRVARLRRRRSPPGPPDNDPARRARAAGLVAASAG
jgi:hypothetical protein